LKIHLKLRCHDVELIKLIDFVSVILEIQKIVTELCVMEANLKSNP
jgi:hypothetical protein